MKPHIVYNLDDGSNFRYHEIGSEIQRMWGEGGQLNQAVNNTQTWQGIFAVKSERKNSAGRIFAAISIPNAPRKHIILDGTPQRAFPISGSRLAARNAGRYFLMAGAEQAWEQVEVFRDAVA